MLSPSQFNEDDLFHRYKRQTYLIALPVGALLIVLYTAMTPMAGLMFCFAMFMVAELSVLAILLWRNSHLLNTVELIFYFSVSVYFFLLIQSSINDLVAVHLLNLENLSAQLNALSMWLIVFLFGAFFTLRPAQSVAMTICIFAGILLMFVNNLRVLSITNELTILYIFRWVNPLSALAIAVLIIQRMGVLQQRHASSDALTGVMNRHALYRVLVQEFERTKRYKKSFFIVLFDVDLFKGINDTFGHIIGDKVLVEMAKFVSQSIRQTDYLGRWGGEEFLLVLPETEIGSAYTLVERLRREISKTKFANVDRITVSFGIAIFQPGQSLEDVLHCADDALYKAKHNGRNQVVINYTCK